MAVVKLPGLARSPEVDALLERGVVSIIPLLKGKQPGYEGWQTIDDEEARNQIWRWNPGQPKPNLGIRLGPTHGDVVDIDLDSVQARSLAPFYLPETATFGRESKGTTHYLYKQTGKDKSPTRKLTWDRTDEKSVVLEFRASGQTMGPGSIHPDTKEPIVWTSTSPIMTIPGDELLSRTLQLASASLLLREWNDGQRDDLSLAITGAMLRAGYAPQDVDAFLSPILQLSNDDEPHKRLKADRISEELKDPNARVPGVPTLSNILGEVKTKKLIDWLSLGRGTLIDDFNREFAVVASGSGAMIIRENNGKLEFINKDAFSLMMSNRHIVYRGRETTADKVWLSSPDRRQYLGGVVFKPEWCGKAPNPTEYNLWSGFAFEPSNTGPGSWDLYKRHVLEEYCRGNYTEFDWVIKWMAHRVQRPWEVPRSSLVLIGERGDGKGTIASLLGRLFGRHYATVTQPSQFLGRFNGHLMDKVLVFADEAIWGGDKTNEGILKVMISEDQRMLEYKGKDAFMVDNCSAYMIASNHSWVVPVGLHERRFYINKTVGNHRGDFGWFESIRAELENGGFQRMLYDLKHMDLTGWRGDNPPKTEALYEQEEQNHPQEIEFLINFLSHDIRGKLEVTLAELYDTYLAWAQSQNQRYPLTHRQFTLIMGKIFEPTPKVRRKVNERTPTGIVERRVWCYQWRDLGQAREELELHLGHPIRWSH